MNNFAVKSTKCGKSLWSVYEGLAFQSTPPLGRRHFFGNIVVFDIPISIHASAREATIFRCPTPGHNHFNPRLREGGDCLVAPVQVIFVLFQSTPPRGRRLMPMCHYLEQHIFQSTPPRGRRLRCRVGCAVLIVISIHASAREATRGLSRQSSSGLHFNPRLREGGDRDAQGNIRKLLLISIHASAREATALITNFYI